MAYMSQEKKKELAPKIKAVMKKYGLKGSIGVNNHSALVIKIKSGKIDFFGNYINSKGEGWSENQPHHYDVNQYHFAKNYTGDALNAISELLEAANDGNWDRSDSQSDYFDIGWYVYLSIGTWDKPYELIVD